MLDEHVEDDHRGVAFGDGPDACDDCWVASSDGGELCVFEGVFINCVLGLINCGGWFDGESYDDGLPGGEAACDAACVVRVEYYFTIL